MCTDAPLWRNKREQNSRIEKMWSTRSVGGGGEETRRTNVTCRRLVRKIKARTIVIRGDRWWPQKAKQVEDMTRKTFHTIRYMEQI